LIPLQEISILAFTAIRKRSYEGARMKDSRGHIVCQVFGPGFFGCVAAAVMIALVSQAAFGHTLWIQSSRYRVKKGLAKPMFFGWGHYLPLDDAISGDKLHYIKVFDPAGDCKEKHIREEKSLHSYLVQYDQVGTYCLAKVLKSMQKFKTHKAFSESVRYILGGAN
jgi:hypothetical protein